jgi:ubiquinone/menaquinone biosynthesis C-methylase UbiE
MKNKKSILSRLSGFTKSFKWKILTALRWNNLKINRVLRPSYDVEIEAIQVATDNLELQKTDYDNFINSHVLQQYKQLDYCHSKPLEYLTTMSLLDLQDGDKILDAAGGEDAEYIKAVIASCDKQLTAYCQDSLLDGKSIDGITYIGGSIDAIPLPDGSLDGISCHHSFEHFRDDLDIKFIEEAIRLLKVGGKLVIAPLFITNKYTEIWNKKPIYQYDPETAMTIFDTTATFAGWGPYEGFARTYSPQALQQRIINRLPNNCQVKIHQIIVDGKPEPDINKNHHQPLLNAEMKVLVISK